APPMQRAPHLLEVYTPGNVNALVLLAEPLGPPGEHGFPLRLSSYEAAPEAAADESSRNPAFDIVEDEGTTPFRSAISAPPAALGEGSDRTIPQMASPVATPSTFPSTPPAAHSVPPLATTPPSAPPPPERPRTRPSGAYSEVPGRHESDELNETTGPAIPRVP